MTHDEEVRLIHKALRDIQRSQDAQAEATLRELEIAKVIAELFQVSGTRPGHVLRWILEPWTIDPYEEMRNVPRREPPHKIRLSCLGVCKVRVRLRHEGWTYWSPHSTRTEFGTEEEAMAAADTFLQQQGFVLLG